MTAPGHDPEASREPSAPARRGPRVPPPGVLLVVGFVLLLVGASTSSIAALSASCVVIAVVSVVAAFVIALRQVAPHSREEAQRMGGVLGQVWRMSMRDDSERPPDRWS